MITIHFKFLTIISLLPVTSTLRITHPNNTTTLDLTTSWSINWTITNKTDDSLMTIYFATAEPGPASAGTIAVNVPCNSLEYRVKSDQVTSIGDVMRYVVIFDTIGEDGEVEAFIAESDLFRTIRGGAGMGATSSGADGSGSPTETGESAARSSDDAAGVGAKTSGAAIGWTVAVGTMFGLLQIAMA